MVAVFFGMETSLAPKILFLDVVDRVLQSFYDFYNFEFSFLIITILGESCSILVEVAKVLCITRLLVQLYKIHASRIFENSDSKLCKLTI